MAAAERAPKGFFADKNRAFWTLQIAGWVGYFLLRSLGGLANRMGISFILPTILVTVTGFSITLLMAWAYRAIIRMKPIWVWTLAVGILVLAAILFSAIEVWAHATFYERGWRPQGIEFFGAILLTLAILGAWTALYYGINYYLMLDEQAERFERMAAQASSAQLEMLRYQINPHFLFNTLNSISTLVLLAETEKANTMLSRLSSFLRYSLVGEREGQATVAQEIQALKLYLEIERTRFEDRLRTRFDIAPDVLNARIPSLLLQPLVENAVKYAVTPLEEGADIWVTARRLGDRLELSVADTGPGIGECRPSPGSTDPDNPAPTGPAPTGPASTGPASTGPASTGPASTGTNVGLANIRERLQQAYGDDHRFEILPNAGSPLVQTGAAKGPGVLAVIEVPLQLVSAAEAARADRLAGPSYEVVQ